MRRVILLTGLALAIGVLLPASAQPAAGGSDLPLKGSQSGYGTWDLVTGQFSVLTSGPLSHLGLSTVDQHVQAYPIDANTNGWFGTWTVTAANGDQLFGTSTGTTTFTDSVHSTSLGTFTSTGGTGRFVDASASSTGTSHNIVVSVEGTTATFFTEITIVGRLSY